MAARNVSFYGPSRGPVGQRQDPRARMAQQLMQQGSSSAPVQSPLEGITRALTAGVGGYFGGKARDEAEAKKAQYAADMMKVLQGGMATPGTPAVQGRPQGGHPGLMDVPAIEAQPAVPGKPGGTEGMLAALGQTGNPDLADTGMQLAMQKIQQQDSARIRQQELADKMALKSAPGGANSPTGRPASPIQNFMHRQKLVGEFGEKSPEVLRFDNYVRATKLSDIGGSVVAFDPAQPTAPTTVADKTLPPEKQIPYIEEAEQAKKGIAREFSLKKALPKARGALLTLERKSKMVTGVIDEAMGLVSGWSAGYGSLMDWLPESDAGKLKNALNTIKANVGFDRLAEMRANSPTGGALGNVSEMENKLLQAVNGSLDPAQSDQLKTNLGIIRDLYPALLKQQREAFETDFGSLSQGPELKKFDPAAIEALLNKHAPVQ